MLQSMPKKLIGFYNIYIVESIFISKYIYFILVVFLVILEVSVCPGNVPLLTKLLTNSTLPFFHQASEVFIKVVK